MPNASISGFIPTLSVVPRSNSLRRAWFFRCCSSETSTRVVFWDEGDVFFFFPLLDLPFSVLFSDGFALLSDGFAPSSSVLTPSFPRPLVETLPEGSSVSVFPSAPCSLVDSSVPASGCCCFGSCCCSFVAWFEGSTWFDGV